MHIPSYTNIIIQYIHTDISIQQNTVDNLFKKMKTKYLSLGFLIKKKFLFKIKKLSFLILRQISFVHNLIYFQGIFTISTFFVTRKMGDIYKTNFFVFFNI